MKKEERELFRRTSYVWVALAVVLVIGLAARAQEQNWLYGPLWFTEIFTFFLIAFFFYYRSKLTAFGAILGSFVWLVNQLACWTGYGDTSLYGGYGVVYVGTAVINLLALIYVVYKQNQDENAGLFFEIAKKDITSLGIIALSLMFIFGCWKLFQVHQQFTYGTDVYYSAFEWGLGILLMSLGSMIQLKTRKKETVYIIILGLVISMIAAWQYGLALSLVGLY
ncbi:MAG: hypothetical protein OEY81_03020 [Candidatus Bathyarchaeota archaeon]|nr:hypothetical protein [Candidatus Bathyarchaeota archaeon]